VRSVRGLGVLGIAGLLWLGLDTPPAQAVEYRLDHLAGSLDRGDAPGGPLLSDRTVRWASERVARAYGAVRVLAEVKPRRRGYGPMGQRAMGREDR
jgi:hypothetical protein